MTKSAINPIPRRFLDRAPELTPAFDAFEAQDSRWPALIEGMACTYDNGRDSYAGRVVAASPTAIVVDLGNLGEIRFIPRDNKRHRGWMQSGKHSVGYLHVGIGDHRSDLDA